MLYYRTDIRNEISPQADVTDEIDSVQLLNSALTYERTLRERAERKIIELENELVELRTMAKKKLTKEDKRIEQKAKAERMTTGLKSDGKPIAKAGDSLRCYEDILIIQRELKKQYKGLRNNLLFVYGLNMGVRTCDLINFKYSYIFDNNLQFRERVFVYESKTTKINEACFITEAMKKATIEYLDSINWEFKLDDFIFEGITHTNTFYKQIKAAAKSGNINLTIGAKVMRKTFASIVATVDKTVVPADAVEKVRLHLNHSDPRITQRYLGILKKVQDGEKQTVSDFILGKTEKKELVFDEESEYTLKQLMDKLNELENTIQGACLC